MKYFTLVMAALVTATAATAAPKMGKAQSMSHPQKIAKTQKAPAKGLELNHKQLDLSKVRPIIPEAVSRAAEMPIYEAEGDAQMYEVNAMGYIQSWGQLYFEEYSAMKNVVWGEGGDVYIQNFVDIGVDTYVLGTYANGKITVRFPQPVFYTEDEEGVQLLYLNVLTYDPDAKYMYKNSSILKRTVTIDVANDGTMSWDLNKDYSYENFENGGELPTFIVGLTEDTSMGVSDWFGYGDCRQEYSVFGMESITPPATAEYDQWVLKYTNDNDAEMAQYIDVAFDGDDIYIGALDSDAVDGWIKGSVVEDGKAYFENCQYLGYSSMYSTNFFFLTGTFEEVYLEEYDFWDFHVEFTDGITFAYDKEAKTLIAEQTDPKQCFVLNGKPDELYYLNIYIDPSLNWQDPALCNANPNNPSVLSYIPWDPDFYGGQGAIMWDIPCTNVKGAILDTNRMYYNFIVDGEIYGIDPEEYTFVEEYMEDIPYDYTDGMDIWAMGDEHDIYFYFDGAESFGLQSFYVGDDDVIYASDLITYVPETTGVDSTKFIQVVDTKYTDLMGREVANPAHGIYIKSMKLADGSVRNVKVIVK